MRQTKTKSKSKQETIASIITILNAKHFKGMSF